MTFFESYDTWPKHQLVYTLSQSHQWQSSWSDQTDEIMTRWSSLASSLTISIIWSKWWDHPHRWSSLALVDAAAMLGRQLQRRPQSDLLGSSFTRTTPRWPSPSQAEFEALKMLTGTLPKKMLHFISFSDKSRLFSTQVQSETGVEGFKLDYTQKTC